MNLFARAWRGQASLAVAFWIIYVLFGIIISIIVNWFVAALYPNLAYADFQYRTMVVQFPYSLYATICVWRCAKNSIPLWRILARFIVGLFLILMIIALVLGAMRRPLVPATTTTTTTVPATATQATTTTTTP